MKRGSLTIRILISLVLGMAATGICFGQSVKAEPVPGAKPVRMTAADFENLQFPASMDRSGKLEGKRGKERLDMLVNLLSPQNRTVEFVVALRGSKPADVAGEIDFVYQYLTNSKKVEPSRFSFVLGMQGQYDTELWLVPNAKVLLPPCFECLVIPADDVAALKPYLPVNRNKKF